MCKHLLNFYSNVSRINLVSEILLCVEWDVKIYSRTSTNVYKVFNVYLNICDLSLVFSFYFYTSTTDERER